MLNKGVADMQQQSFLVRIIDWLAGKPVINGVMVVSYFTFIMFMHNPLVHLSMYVEGFLSLKYYNAAIAVIYSTFLITLTVLLWQYFKRYTDNMALKIAYLTTTIAIIIIHSRFMFDSNIEIIHSFEFTILAFLLFPFTRRYGAAILFTLPFMLFDEWYKYRVLYPDWNDYFDLNDVAMDTYGCALTMIVLLISGVKAEMPIKPFYKRIEFLLLAAGSAIVLLLGKLCYITPYLNSKCSNTLLVMNQRMDPEPLFRVHPTHFWMYHVMSPAEGFVVIVVIMLFFFGLDSLRQPNNVISNSSL
jgi:hypothetical protein